MISRMESYQCIFSRLTSRVWAFALDTTETEGNPNPFSLPHTDFGTFQSIDLFAAHAMSSAFQGISASAETDKFDDDRKTGFDGFNGVNSWINTRSGKSFQEQRTQYIQVLSHFLPQVHGFAWLVYVYRDIPLFSPRLLPNQGIPSFQLPSFINQAETDG
jgi:hypothetical protein